MDEFEQWLQEQVNYWRGVCLEYVESIGYPGKIKFAREAPKNTLDTFEEVLEKYREYTAPDAGDGDGAESEGE